jgi:CubicO group peptidase (beta-lactamase class C family)
MLASLTYGEPSAAGLSPGGLAAADAALQEAMGVVCPAAVVLVARHGVVALHRAYGWLDPETKSQPTRPDSIFDLASVTKLFATTAFMTLVEAGRVALDQPVADVLPAFRGPRPLAPYEDPLNPGAMIEVVPATSQVVEAGQVTFRQLLTHTSGLPAWKPLYKLPGGREAIYAAAAQAPFAYPPGQPRYIGGLIRYRGQRVLYSDLGLILLGEAIGRIAGQCLDAFLRQSVLEPLGLATTHYRSLPESAHPLIRYPSADDIAPTELCAWRGRRLRGEVHDENAAGMGGVSGHAGLFSTAWEVAVLGQLYLNGGEYAGQRLLAPAMVAEMTREQAAFADERRGLGWMLKSLQVSSAGRYFSPRSYGHTGFTGTSLWVDPQRELLVVLLTNRVYYGRSNAAAILALRQAVHEAISCDLEV